MGLPTTREITAAPNTTIPSSSYNAIQDAIIGSWIESCGQILPTLSSTDNPNGAPGIHHMRAPGYWTLGANVAPIYFPIVLPPNSVITEWHLDIHKNDTDTQATAELIYADSSAETAIAGTSNGSGVVSGLATMGVSGLAIDVVEGRQYYLKFTPGGTITPAADLIENARIVYTRH